MPSVRRVRWARFRIAAVAVAACAIFGALVYLLTGGSLLRAKSVLVLYIPDATGLGPGAPIRVDGIGVGKVASVALSGSNEPNRVVRVTLAVDRDHLSDIPVDSFAQISADNLVGDQFVDITSGHRAEHIQPGGMVAFKAQPELLKTLDMAQFADQLRIMGDVLSDIEAGRGLVGQFVMGEAMYSGLVRQVADIERGVRAAASKATPMGQAFYTDTLFRDMVATLAGFDKTLAGLQSGQGPSGRFFSDPAGYDSFRQAAADLRKSIAGWRASEIMTSDSLYADWNRRVSSLIRAVDEFNAGPALTSSELYDSWNGAARQLGETIKDLRSDPRKFLRMKLF
jgi:phospholipid/cholesterol/gamma-HCH transport system substrate-binding protein